MGLKQLPPIQQSETLTRARYLARETQLGLWRGGWLNGAAVLTVAVLLFLFGFGFNIASQIDTAFQQLGSRLEITAYLEPGQAPEPIQTQLEQLPNTAQVILVSKDQAWQELLKDLGASDITTAAENQGLLQNPLVDEFKIIATRGEEVPQLAAAVKTIPGINSVQYLDKALASLQTLSQSAQRLGGILVIALAVTAVAVIATVMQLLAVVRQPEIEIMELVGATPRWIYLPFLVQGAGLGTLGGLLAWGGISLTEQALLQWLGQQGDLLKLLGQLLASSVLGGAGLLLILLLLGAVVGLIGSSFIFLRGVRGTLS
ncbi:permease-like cell division protein FtsX [Thermosynechococcaceae cyanobacterium BACA0444]|uniref:Cell division protein FtsX n=1 Tax=Pseudocalidococcus azoricus BACA0444 TaxID=2918990 RepID=A0AAE4FR11_9CYAN|nr:permease-like cell division protein FtsX [Pseudocalidococcus azoricus]MDS3860525.1 permease-like cell division protein FtsX [Pseudocalidococcus azoricus BACA0444]